MKQDLFKKKYDYNKVLQLRKDGLSYSKIEKALDMKPGTASGIVNPKKKKRNKKAEDPKTFYDYNKVLNLLKNKRSNNEIHQELRPDIDVANFYKWKETLTSEERSELKKYTRPAVKGKLLDVKISRSFEYKETCLNDFLPIGLVS